MVRAARNGNRIISEILTATLDGKGKAGGSEGRGGGSAGGVDILPTLKIEI